TRAGIDTRSGEMAFRGTSVYPLGASAPHALSDNAHGSLIGPPAERARLEWWVGSPGDPAQLLADFLADAGLPRPGLGGPATMTVTRKQPVAAVLISAAAGAAMAGAPTSRPGPVPAVPDLVAVVFEEFPPPPASPAAGFHLGPWQASWTPEQHAGAVREVRAAIGRGDVYQVNLVGHASARYRGDPAGALHRVTQLPGARYPGRLGGDGWVVACASP